VKIRRAARTTSGRKLQLLASISALGVAVLVAGCGGDASESSPESQSDDVSGAAIDDAGSHPSAGGPCVPADIQRGLPPDWTASARVRNLPYAIASGDRIAGFYFVHPLRAGHPRQRNKVLWVVGDPRDGNPLLITARQMRGGGRTVRFRQPADSGPGEIYPTILELPSAGCWRFAMRWGSYGATIDLRVRRRSSP